MGLIASDGFQARCCVFDVSDNPIFEGSSPDLFNVADDPEVSLLPKWN